MADDFYERRRKLLKFMTERAKAKGEEVIAKSIFYRNNDIQKFLKWLDKFEEESLNSKLEFKANYAA